MRRFPPPWTVERLPGGYVVEDASGVRLAFIYGRENPAGIPGAMTLDEARRIAAGIARLPQLLGRDGAGAADP